MVDELEQLKEYILSSEIKQDNKIAKYVDRIDTEFKRLEQRLMNVERAFRDLKEQANLTVSTLEAMDKRMDSIETWIETESWTSY